MRGCQNPLAPHFRQASWREGWRPPPPEAPSQLPLGEAFAGDTGSHPLAPPLGTAVSELAGYPSIPDPNLVQIAAASLHRPEARPRKSRTHVLGWWHPTGERSVWYVTRTSPLERTARPSAVACTAWPLPQQARTCWSSARTCRRSGLPPQSSCDQG